MALLIVVRWAYSIWFFTPPPASPVVEPTQHHPSINIIRPKLVKKKPRPPLKETERLVGAEPEATRAEGKKPKEEKILPLCGGRVVNGRCFNFDSRFNGSVK
jgi:hypothetical protein